MRGSIRQWAVLAMVAAAAGCESATEPGTGGPAPMEVEVRGDDGNGVSAYRAAQPASSSSSTSGSASGTIDISARIYLQNRTGEWVAIGDAAARQTVAASGSDGYRLLVSDTVQASSYTRVRVEFEQVDTWLSADVSLGGNLLRGWVRVDAGSDGRATVERELRIDARSGSTARLQIDLNADAWLNHASSSSQVVSEAEFTSAVRITAR